MVFRLIAMLLEHGWSVNAQDKRGRTPLHHAADRDNVGAIK